MLYNLPAHDIPSVHLTNKDITSVHMTNVTNMMNVATNDVQITLLQTKYGGVGLSKSAAKPIWCRIDYTEYDEID